MPWQVYNSAGQLLQATDLVDGTVTASKLDTNAVTNAKVADDAIGVAELSATGTASNSTFLRGDNAWVAVGGATTREGGNTTEATTSSTTAMNLVTVASLSITQYQPMQLFVSGRKDDAGTGNHINIGIAVISGGSTTVIGEASIGSNNIWTSTNTDTSMNGVGICFVGGRASGYQRSATGTTTTWDTAGSTRRHTVHIENAGGSTNTWPVATYTSVILRAISNSPLAGVAGYSLISFTSG